MKYFCGRIHVFTDRMGGWANQYIEVGWYDSNEKKYYDLDEVHELYNTYQTENVGEREDGTLYMKSCLLDARTAFSVVCGIPFGNFTKHYNLLEYCKNHGIVSQGPQSIHMYAGTKSLNIETIQEYTITYRIYDRIWEMATDNDKQFIEKMCIGKINKLRHSYINYIRKGETYKKYVFSCNDIYFQDHTLYVSKIPYDSVANIRFIDYIRNLDLQILMSLTHEINFWNIFDAARQMCYNQGQNHLLNEEYDKTKADIYWWDKLFKF